MAIPIPAQPQSHRRPISAASELAIWQSNPDAETFPYDVVVAEFHRAGKHLVPTELLEALDRVRAGIPGGSGTAHQRLVRFLDTALDKHDGRYDNPSYLALAQLSLPGADGHENDPEHATHRRDRVLALLMADVMRFEIAALDGRSRLLPEMRPDARTVAKRCRHALRAARPALERLGIAVDPDETDPVAAARRVCCAVLRDTTPAERRTLQLTALPVSLIHDEYMFFRVLQSYETAFALAGVQIRAAVAALAAGDGEKAADLIDAAEQALRESSPLFSLVGTMQPEAFLTFRQFTDGASAIQSRSYKRVESLCRRPDQERLDSPAYTSVPDVREQVAAGLPNVDEAMRSAHAAGLVSREECGKVCVAKKRLEDAVLKWRQTHYRLAVRMLGERRGTGYTEGVGYLDKGREIPLFESGCPVGHATRAAVAHSGRTHETRRCPDRSRPHAGSSAEHSYN